MLSLQQFLCWNQVFLPLPWFSHRFLLSWVGILCFHRLVSPVWGPVVCCVTCWSALGTWHVVKTF
jgi:hypothetical protein